MQFSDLGLSAALLNAIEDKGYSVPSPIQEQAIPAILRQRDVIAAAQTGTGKTAAFTLPILNMLAIGPRAQANQARSLILTPTRELAQQIEDNLQAYGKYLPLRATVVYGGVKINPQMQRLCRGVDVLVATPGRLLDLYRQNAIRFDQLEVFVLDEADRMLDMGFMPDIKRIIATLPKQRQNLLFSATFSDKIRQLAKTFLHDPVEITVSPKVMTASTVEHWLHPVDKSSKPALLTHLIHDKCWHQVLVFTRTKHGANRLTRHLQKSKITAAAIHGDKSQGARKRALAEFKSGELQALVATDIASRGIDIDNLEQVVNFDLPKLPEDYVHRIGRTGRAGAAGQAISLVCADESEQLFEIERLIKQSITREDVEGFIPGHKLPLAKQGGRLDKSNKPKKAKGSSAHQPRNTQAPRSAKPKRRRHAAT